MNLPVSAATKAIVDALKPRGVTYDRFLRRLVERQGPAAIWDEEESAENRDVQRAFHRRMAFLGAPSTRRDPSEQVALAEAAKDRFDHWLGSAQVQIVGGLWKVRLIKGRSNVRVRRVR
jgi:hypothetical protein